MLPSRSTDIWPFCPVAQIPFALSVRLCEPVRFDFAKMNEQIPQSVNDSDPTSPTGFAALGVAPELLSTLASLGYEEPTPIQREAIPTLLAGRDLLGQAATGTGKTAAFALPMLQLACNKQAERNRPLALVLVPTRELA